MVTDKPLTATAHFSGMAVSDSIKPVATSVSAITVEDRSATMSVALRRCVPCVGANIADQHECARCFRKRLEPNKDHTVGTPILTT